MEETQRQCVLAGWLWGAGCSVRSKELAARRCLAAGGPEPCGPSTWSGDAAAAPFPSEAPSLGTSVEKCRAGAASVGRGAGRVAGASLLAERWAVRWLQAGQVGSLSRSLLAFAAIPENQTFTDFAPVTIETLRHMCEYVATPLDWWHADRYCEQRFAQLLFEPRGSEQASFSKLLQSHRIKDSVWLNEMNGVLPKPKWRQDHIVPVLVFGDKTDTKYVKVLSDFPALPAVTACAHLQWDTRTQEIATIFSYAVPAFINEFQLRGFVDEEGFVRFALIIHGHHSPYLPVFRADGHWHHFCVTWQQENGTCVPC
nr:PREDICTED: adhesion G-protein coupled receptor D2-like [Apteryx mantelli mantelli]